MDDGFAQSIARLDRRTLLLGTGAMGLGSLLPARLAAAPFAGAEEIQKIIDEGVAARQFPGAVVSLGTGTGAPQFVKGGTVGFDSRVPADENTLWRMASLTKPVAGMAAMLLIGEGKIKLDQPIADFIPAFADMRVLTSENGTETRPASRPITIRNLITHTNGLVAVPTGAQAEAYARLGLRESRGVTIADAMPPPQSLKEWTERIATAPLAAEPGTKWIYSPGLDVLGRIAEIVSSQLFDVFLERRIFTPLGMSSTGFWVPEKDKTRLATLYKRKNDQLVVTDPGLTSELLNKPAIPRASGGLVSTAHDFDRFMAMVVNLGTLDGVHVIHADAVRLSTSNILPPGTDMSAYTSRTGADGFGAGGMVTIGGLRTGTYGWGGSSGTTGFMNPTLGSRWATFTNVGAGAFGRKALAAAGMEIGCDPRRGISCS